MWKMTPQQVLQSAFDRLHVDKYIDVQRLTRGKYMDNLEFMQASGEQTCLFLHVSGEPHRQEYFLLLLLLMMSAACGATSSVELQSPPHHTLAR